MTQPKRVDGLTQENDVASISLLVDELGGLIHHARSHVANTANQALTTLYWAIGQRVHIEILDQARAPYGKQIVAAVGQQLGQRFGRGFSEKSLRRMIQFATAFPNAEIVATASRQLGWSHFVELIPIEDAVTAARERLAALPSEAKGPKP